MNRAHFCRPDICVNGKPVAEQAREQYRAFAHGMALDQFNQRGNALSISTLRWPRGFVFSRGRLFEAFNHEARSLGFYQTERAAAKAVLRAPTSRAAQNKRGQI
jgi:hypothetical protein